MTIERHHDRHEAEAARHHRLAAMRASLTNLPNLLTMLRVLAIPGVLYFIDNASPRRSFISMLFCLVAVLTDFFDGWLARHRKQVSLLGKFLDPLADKLLVSAVLVYAAALHRCPPWLVVVLLARELAVTGLRSIASTEGLVIVASGQGKQKANLQMTGMLFLLVHFRYRVLFTDVYLDFHLVGLYTLYLSLLMSLVSGAGYLRAFIRALYAPRPSPPTSDSA